MENKDLPKKLKKKLPKEPPSGESREKKLKPKGECPGDGHGSSPAPLPLASVLAGTRGWLVSHLHCCPGRLRGGCGAIAPSSCNLPPAQPFPLPPPCHLPVLITAHPHPTVRPLIGSCIPLGDRSDPDSKAKSAKSTKKEPMSVFQVNGEKKKSKKKGMGRVRGWQPVPTAPWHHPEPTAPGAM